MAFDFPRSSYNASDGNSINGWSSSPSNGDTASAGGYTFTYNGTSSLWVMNSGQTKSFTGAATYTWDGEKWNASNIPDSSNTIFTSDTPLDGEVLKFESSGSTFVFDSPQNLIPDASASQSGMMTAAQFTKLAGIEAAADVTDAANVDAAGAVMNSDTSTASMSFVVDEDNMSSNNATKVPTQQSVKSYVDNQVASVVDTAPAALDTLNELAAALGDDANFSTTVSNSIGTKLPLSGGTMTGNIVMSGSQTVDGRDLSADGSKLDGIEANATADQTAAEIRTLVESATDSNVFTDADHTKLNGIAAGAEVNVQSDWNASSGDAQILNKPTIPAAYTNSSVDAHLNQSSASTGQTLIWNGSDYSWGTPAASYGNSNVDSHLNRSSASTGQSLTWNGSDYAWATVSGSGGDADTVDGIHASSFIRSDTQDSVTGPIEFSNGTLQTYDPTSGTTGSDTATDVAIALGSGHRIVGHSGGYIRSLLEWNTSGDITFGQGNTAMISGINLLPGSSGQAKVNGNRILTVADEGGGNGLDADTVDGIQAASFLRSDTDDTMGARLTLTPSGFVSGIQNVACLNISSAGSAETRAIDIDGSWVANENKSISFIHGTSASNFVGQINCLYNGTGSEIRFGRFYHGADTSAYPVVIRSTSTSTADLIISGQIENASTAGASGAILGNLEVGYGANYNSVSARSNNSLHLNYNSTGTVYVGTNKTVWHSGNDGSGSGLDADTVDGVHASSFALLSGATFTGDLRVDNDADLRIGDGAANERILIQKANNMVSDHIIFYNGTTRVGEIGCQDTSWLRINQVTAKNIYTPRYIRADGGFFVDGASYGINGSGVLVSATGATIGGSTVWHAGNDGSGSGLDADTVDGVQAANFLRSDTYSGNSLFRVAAGDGNGIRFWNGSSSYAIWMSASSNSTYGGRLDSTSDYNMYFRMNGGTNRGFVFQNGSTEIAQIEGNGNFTATGNVTAYSDARLKTNIEVISNALDKVSQIRGVTFDRTDTGIKQSGVIAQEVEKVLPEVVTTGENDMKSVAYGNMNGLLIEAIKELRAEVADLKSQLGVS